MGKPLIAGVGFATIGELPDLSGLDRALGRIEDLGASHVELAFFAADLISGGRVLPEPRRRLELSCRPAQTGLHRAWHACRQPDGRGQPGPAQGGMPRQPGTDCGRRRHRAGDHPGTVPARPPHELDRLHAIERAALREMGDVAARLGIRLAVETLFVEAEQEYTADPVRLAAELRAVDHPHVVGTLDVSHSYLMTSFRGTSFTEAIAAFAPVTGHFHLHHSFGRPPGTLSGILHRFGAALCLASATCICRSAGATSRSRRCCPASPCCRARCSRSSCPSVIWAELERCAAFARGLMDRMNGAARC